MHEIEALILAIEAVFLGIITAAYETMGWPGVVFLMAVESAGIPFPSELIMPLAGWLLVQDKGGSHGMVWTTSFRDQENIA